jgi:AraC-like DNA-binding protein
VRLGDCWAAYAGPSDQNSPHAHVAVQLTVVAKGRVVVRLGRSEIAGRGVIVRPLATHQIAPDLETATFFYIEPQAPLGRAMLTLLGSAAAIPAPPSVLRAFKVGSSPVAWIDTLERALHVPERPALDRRLAAALAMLEASADEAATVAKAATAAELSTSRLRALARAELGTPLARWLVWRKLARAARALADGESLAEAALTGGFADQAHLSRVMRRTFGVTPRTAAGTLRRE